MEYKDIAGMIDLAEDSEKIAAMINKYGFYIMLGREEECINERFVRMNEFDRKRLLKAIKEANPIIHHEFGLI